MKFTGTVVVTGGTSGIGAALVGLLARSGCSVITCGRDPARLKEVCAAHPGVVGHVVDLADPAATAAFADQISLSADLIGLINNAAGQQDVALDRQPWADIDREIRANFTAPAILTGRLLPALVASGGFVVNITSGLAIAPKSSAAVYCASKAALRNLTVGVRNQVRDTALRVIEVVMPLVETPMTQGRGSGKISAEVAAAAVLDAIQAEQPEAYVGKAAHLRRMDRLSPALAQRFMRGMPSKAV